MNNEQASQELSVLAGALVVAPEGACLKAGEEEPWLDAMMRGGIAE